MGSTGVGKSSTINFLFNINQRDHDGGDEDDIDDDNSDDDDAASDNKSNILAATSDMESETRTITEYLLVSSDEEFEVSDVKLGITDSPGSNDTAGQNQDACNMYAIKKFYETHPSFKGRAVYPNLVFLMIQAGDKRFSGCTSNLVKAMKSLKKLKLVDSENPNIVGVITHASHLDRNKKHWIKSFLAKKKKFQEIIQKTFNFEADIVAIENFPIRAGLKRKGYGFLLPDEETMQPKNMFDACTKLLRNNGDKFGYLAFTSTFKQKNLAPQYGHSVIAKNAKLAALSLKEESFLSFWQESALGDSYQDPLITKAEDFCQKNNVQPETKTKVINTANKLKRFYNKSELKGISTNLIAQKTGIELETETMDFLEELGVKKTDPVNADNSIMLLGNGFNLVTNKTVTQKILDFDLRDTKHGVCVPEPATFQLVNKTEQLMCKFESVEDFVKTRLNRWGIGIPVDLNDKILLDANDGLSSSGRDITNERLYLFVVEHRIFRVSLSDLSKIALTDHFKKDVEHLPKAFKENVARYERFFDKWGHFLITEAYGGGNVEFKKRSANCESEAETEEQFFASMCNSLNENISIAENRQELDAEYEHNVSAGFSDNLNMCRFDWNGGDSSLHYKTTVSDPEKLKEWVLSLSEKPTMLKTEMSLAPISDLVDLVDREKGDACYEALECVLGGHPRPKTQTEEAQQLAVAVAANRDEEVAISRQEAEKADGKSCFPGDSMVTRISSGIGDEEEVPMKCLKVGDLVKTFSLRTKQIVFSPVLLFAHYEPNENTKFREIYLADGKALAISENHLIFSNTKNQSKMAADLVPGDLLFTLGVESTQKGDAISEITDVIKRGFFCPITEEGTIIVNNILCSCYASCQRFLGIDPHNFAHAWLFPMRLLKNQQRYLVKDGKDTTETMHPYIRILEKISRDLPFRL